MPRATSTIPLLVFRQVASPDAPAVHESLTIRSAERGVFLYETSGRPGCKLVAFDADGTARLTLEVARQDYTPRIAKWMQRCVGDLSAK